MCSQKKGATSIHKNVQRSHSPPLWKGKDSLGVAFLYARGAVGAASHC